MQRKEEEEHQKIEKMKEEKTKGRREN